MSPHMTPLQNRVDPWGQLHAVRARGTLMGNRGILHNAANSITKPWAHASWVTCTLAETFQKRSPFSPGTYSELFFLDEATAYAAGHRPCRSCQRQRHDEFNAAWTAANRPEALVEGRSRVPIREIDSTLHAERVGPARSKRTHPARLADLPVGAMFCHDNLAWLVGPHGLRRWAFDGYLPAHYLAPSTEVALLTPPSVVAALRCGLAVSLHPSAV